MTSIIRLDAFDLVRLMSGQPITIPIRTPMGISKHTQDEIRIELTANAKDNLKSIKE